MDIVALVGPGSCGKTTTLNIVYDSVIQNGGVSTNRQPQGANPTDFSDIVLYKGNKIAFFTMGDYAQAVIAAVRNYSAKNCDKLVIACNDGFVRPFNEFANHNHTIINKTAHSPQLQQADDNATAQKIFNML